MDEDKNSVQRLKKGLKRFQTGASEAEQGYGRYLHLGFTFALAALLFCYAGYRLDKWLGTLPIFTLLGTFLGGIGGFFYIYKELTARDRRK